MPEMWIRYSMGSKSNNKKKKSIQSRIFHNAQSQKSQYDVYDRYDVLLE